MAIVLRQKQSSVTTSSSNGISYLTREFKWQCRLKVPMCMCVRVCGVINYLLWFYLSYLHLQLLCYAAPSSLWHSWWVLSRQSVIMLTLPTGVLMPQSSSYIKYRWVVFMVACGSYFESLTQKWFSVSCICNYIVPQHFAK